MIKESFDNIFDSSLVDYSSDFEKSDKIQMIKNWLYNYLYVLDIRTNNGINDWSKIENTFHINTDYTIDLIDDKYAYIILRGDDKGLVNNELPDYIQFNECKGSFAFDAYIKLKSLKGSPRIVLKDFEATNNNLSDFIGGPQIVNGHYNVAGNLGISQLIWHKLHMSNPFYKTNLDKLNILVNEYGFPKDLKGDFIYSELEEIPTPDLITKKERCGKRIYCNKTHLNESFDNIFDSSLVDYSSDFEKSDKYYQIKNWMDEFTSLYFIKINSLTDYAAPYYKINDDYTIDINANGCMIFLKEDKLSNDEAFVDGELPEYIQFNKCEGDFIASRFYGKLTSLRGFPKYVEGDFDISFNDLSDLFNGPEIVGGNYYINGNMKLSRLLRINGGFPNGWVRNYKKLHDKYGFPTFDSNSYLYGGRSNFIFSDDQDDNKNMQLMVRKSTIIDEYKNTLNESFSNVFDSSLIDYRGDFEQQDKDYQERLRIKNWLDKYRVKNYRINDDYSVDVDGNVYLNNHNLEKIEVQFNKVSGFFNCCHNKLTSLEGCPKEVGEYFMCNDNQLTSLEGCPKKVGGSFYCNNNQLTSLEGCPEKIGGNFYCNDNQLTSLEGCPKEVSKDFGCHNNKLASDWTEEKLRSICNIKGNIIGLNDQNKINESFSNVFDSSLVDYSNDFEKQDSEYKKKEIINWIQDNIVIIGPASTIGFLSYYNNPIKESEKQKNLKFMSFFEINDDFTIDVINPYSTSPFADFIWIQLYPHNDNFDLININEIPDYIQFNVCDINFKVANQTDLKSLRGLPKKIKGKFMVDSNGIRDLIGGPEYVRHEMYVRNNHELVNFKGAPKKCEKFTWSDYKSEFVAASDAVFPQYVKTPDNWYTKTLMNENEL